MAGPYDRALSATISGLQRRWVQGTHPGPGSGLCVVGLLRRSLLGRRATGGLGFFASKLQPALRGSPFVPLNLLIYSPLCLLLAALVALSLRAE